MRRVMMTMTMNWIRDSPSTTTDCGSIRVRICVRIVEYEHNRIILVHTLCCYYCRVRDLFVTLSYRCSVLPYYYYYYYYYSFRNFNYQRSCRILYGRNGDRCVCGFGTVRVLAAITVVRRYVDRSRICRQIRPVLLLLLVVE